MSYRPTYPGRCRTCGRNEAAGSSSDGDHLMCYECAWSRLEIRKCLKKMERLGVPVEVTDVVRQWMREGWRRDGDQAG